jgi:alpha-glucosidase
VTSLLAVSLLALDLARVERARVLKAADAYLGQPPITVTAARSPRSAGGPHDYFSEADYWWPDPANPDGPYVQRDGLTNPDNFDDHRKALRRLSLHVPALTAAWRLTGDARYAEQAARHLRAWFVDDATRMSPHLLYSQAIKGRVTGRGIGIIDTLHLVEVARAFEVLEGAPGLKPAEREAVRRWFADYLTWMTTHPYGIEEREAKNNHGTCWALQAAAFARVAQNQEQLAFVRERFKTVLLPNQMAADGSFPQELRRTKPYGYSLFNLEAFAGLAQLLDLWTFTLPDGRGMRRAMEYMVPFIRDKKSWPLAADVMYHDQWPMRQASLLFAGLAFREPSYLELWKTLPADSDVDEVIRNFFIRQPLLWVEAPVQKPGAPSVTVVSPDKKVRIDASDVDGTLRHRVSLDGRPVIEESKLGMLVDGRDFGAGVRLGSPQRFATNGTYPWRGVHARAVDRSNGARIPVLRDGRPVATLELRAFDDAAAFRFVVPGAGVRVPDAASEFRLPAGSTLWYHGPRDHYEGLYSRRLLEDVPKDDWVGVPLTFRLPEAAGYASITEAGLREYAGMTLQADGSGGLLERLGHAPPASYPYTLRYGEENAKRLAQPAAISGVITTPWRVVLLGKDLNALVNSDAITNLAAPPDPKLFPQGIATPWLRTGRAVWRYLDGGGTCEQVPDGPDRVSCQFGVIRDFSRLAGELGFEHQVVEGQWRRWSDEQIRQQVDSARQRNVSLWLWLHSRDLRVPEERQKLFARLHGLGVAGLKIDFLDHEAKEVIDLYHALLRDAAEQRLMVDFHGANKPAGESRTWPNEMTREGVRGMEYRSTPAWAEHNTTIPFARLLAGPADYTPVVFGERRKDTTWAHQIATAVVFTSPVLIYGGHPQSLLDNPAADVIKSIPSVWDETRVLPESAIGELALFARRSGERWFLGVLNGKTPRTQRLPLSFLGKGRYRATLVKDDPGNGAAVVMEERVVTARDFVDLSLRDGGGLVARFTR